MTGEQPEDAADIFEGQAGVEEALNLRDVKDFEALPIGAYHTKVVQCLPKVGAESKEKYYAWRFEIIEPVDHAGRLLFLNTSRQPQALWKLKEVLAAIGENVDVDNYKVTPTAYLGRECVVVVDGHTKYQGKDRETVGSVRSWDAKEGSPF